ncbi:circadian clock-controlled protein daywake-like [Pararge aegeria]|uniref:circadian clock-controlled protein daywake-like n=1 Tax=Pararge aegeria TaxID=116150 RepID=UPI0019D2A709|nr:circadian clock-controlled protein daywake-like [Pararge aegeria]
MLQLANNVLMWVRLSAASFIEPCYSRDRACLLRSAQRAVAVVAGGVPALGMQPLDPMHVARVDAGQAGLTMQFTNTIVKGLRNCRVADIARRSSYETSLTLSCHVELVGDYSLGGKLLMLPIQGQGRYKIRLQEIQVTVTMQVGERVAGGERYWTVRSWQHNADATQRVLYQFQNLFQGNKDMSDAVHKFANENWHRIFQEVAPPIVKAIITQIVAEITKLFERVPIRQLALD